MPLTLQDLYAQPEFVEKVEQALKKEIMSWTFETENPRAINPKKVPPVAVSLGTIKFSDEDEERIQGESIVTAKIAVSADIIVKFKARLDGGEEEVTENTKQDFLGAMNFSFPWSWQARDAKFVIESVQVALTDLWTP